ncbi:MAG TPA: homoserine dehydrogenase [Ferruginibacter sp.]|nr:homoserine dehydrogenase [Ferruginibacter sp.]
MIHTINNQPAITGTHLNIGLFGFGVVGKGLYDVIQTNTGLSATISKICIKDPYKKRAIDKKYFTTNANELLEDDNINLIVELIDDAEAAYVIVKKALCTGKPVVSANKKMIADHLEELLQLQQLHNTSFLYEAACCASMPIIRNLEEYYDNDMLISLHGIINGSSNFILTKIFNEGLSFREALVEAQQLGFAESNPSLDINGHDAANKLTILIAHAFGLIINPREILFNGISDLKKEDTSFAKEKKCRIKLIAHAQKTSTGQLAAFVLPQFVTEGDDLCNVSGEFNGIITESCFADKHFFKGRGAGSYPTAAAVLSDISALRYGYKYEYKKCRQPGRIELTKDYFLKIFISAQDITRIPKEKFEWIDEWHNEFNYSWAIGVMNASHLFEGNWWRINDMSLILCADPFLENIDYKKIGRKSLELAGVL